MGRKLTPKCKQCRRAGEKLFLKGEKCFTAKCPIIKRNYPPGIHGPNMRVKRMSEYGIQLKEKQKAKAMYRLMEKQFYGYYIKALNSAQETGSELLKLLERRLDNAVFRSGFATSRDQARQFVGHGHVYVNGRRVNIPSFKLKTGDKITLKPSSQDLSLIKENLGKKKQDSAPDWIDFTPKDLTAQVVNTPQDNDIDIGINTQLIIEYYSR